MAQEVSYWPLNTEAWVQSQAHLACIVVDCANMAGFIEVLKFSCQNHSTGTPLPFMLYIISANYGIIKHTEKIYLKQSYQNSIW
jgi:hypothetical protein